MNKHFKYSGKILFGLCAFGLILALCAPGIARAQELSIDKIEITSHKEKEELRFHVNRSFTYKTFFLTAPDRFVLDMPVAQWRVQQVLPKDYKGNWLHAMRVGRFNQDTTRVVFDLETPLRLLKSEIRPEGDIAVLTLGFESLQNKPNVTVSDNPAPAEVRRTNRSSRDWTELAERETEIKPLPEGVTFKVIPVPRPKPSSRTQKPVIVIDAGHGGRDPGAIGASGAHEKDITLEYARALSKGLLQTGKYHVVLTRDDDTFIMLRERLGIGRRAKADVFISLHADTAENAATKGFSIYTLSNTASDSEAAALAARENKVDLVYGLNLSQEEQDVTEILIDLAQRETMKKSSRLADILADNLSKEISPLPNTHRYAGFAVLKAPDVPSVLIELGFLSNKQDEKRIANPAYREKAVSSLVQGLDAYFKSHRFE